MHSPLPGSLHSFGGRHEPNYKIRHDPTVMTEYPFEFSPPHYPMEAPSTVLADYPPPLGYTHKPISEEFSQETSYSFDCHNTSPSLRKADSEAKALPTNIPQTQGALPAEKLSILTLINVQIVGSTSSSLRNIVSILDLHTLGFLLLTETPSLPNNEALTHTLRNRGYKIHYHPVNAPTPPGTLPEARLPTHLTHSGDGCWIAYRKLMR
jgi:hypothetical protein